MSRGNRFCYHLLTAFIGTVLLLAAAPVPSSQGITVGEFIIMVAAHLQPVAGEKDATTPEGAARVLNKAGVQFKSDLASSLTAEDAINIFQQLGITLTAQRPETLLEKDRAAALVVTFGNSFRVRSGGASASSVISANQGTSGTPTPTLETTIWDCKDLPKVKDCFDCCRTLGYPGRPCGHVCNKAYDASAINPDP